MRRFTDEEKQAAIDLYFREHLTTQGVVDRLGYPTRQNLERWLSKDARYGSNFRRGFYPVDEKSEPLKCIGQETIRDTRW